MTSAKNAMSDVAATVLQAVSNAIVPHATAALKMNSVQAAIPSIRKKKTMPNPKTHPLTRRHLRRPRRKRHDKLKRPILRFSPYAWAKLLFLRDVGPTEVGGFGVTEAEDLLFVNDFVLIEQHCTEVTVEFTDTAVADYFEDQIDRQRKPEQFARIWIHTHPGDSPKPSSIDVNTFDRVFGNCDWAVMFIIAKGGKTYAELFWRHGGPAALRMRVEVDYSQQFACSDHHTWDNEYKACVRDQSAFDYLSTEPAWADWIIENCDEAEEFDDSMYHFDPQEADYAGYIPSNNQENA